MHQRKKKNGGQMTTNDLLSRKLQIKDEMKKLKSELEQINSHLEDRYLSKAKSQLVENTEKQGFGTTVIHENDKKVSVTILRGS